MSLTTGSGGVRRGFPGRRDLVTVATRASGGNYSVAREERLGRRPGRSASILRRSAGVSTASRFLLASEGAASAQRKTAPWLSACLPKLGKEQLSKEEKLAPCEARRKEGRNKKKTQRQRSDALALLIGKHFSAS